MSQKETLLASHDAVLEFLRDRYPMFHRSNVFFRDIQYGLQAMGKERGIHLTYVEAEELARQFVDVLETRGVLAPVDRQTWILNYPAFKKPPVKQPEAPKPAAKPAEAPKAAAATAPAAKPEPPRPAQPPKPTGAA